MVQGPMSGINIARIQKIDARIKSPIEHTYTLFFGGGISKIIGTKAQARHIQSCSAQISEFHFLLPKRHSDISADKKA